MQRLHYSKMMMNSKEIAAPLRMEHGPSIDSMAKAHLGMSQHFAGGAGYCFLDYAIASPLTLLLLLQVTKALMLLLLQILAHRARSPLGLVSAARRMKVHLHNYHRL